MERWVIFREINLSFQFNGEAGDHYATLCEVVRLMIGLLYMNDDAIFTKQGITQTLYDLQQVTSSTLNFFKDLRFGAPPFYLGA